MVDFIKLDYHLEDLDRALTMMSSLLNSMVEEMKTEFTDIRAKVKSISEGVEVADTIEIALLEIVLLKSSMNSSQSIYSHKRLKTGVTIYGWNLILPIWTFQFVHTALYVVLNIRH